MSSWQSPLFSPDLKISKPFFTKPFESPACTTINLLPLVTGDFKVLEVQSFQDFGTVCELCKYVSSV
jgi:hypothetical protein